MLLVQQTSSVVGQDSVEVVHQHGGRHVGHPGQARGGLVEQCQHVLKGFQEVGKVSVLHQSLENIKIFNKNIKLFVGMFPSNFSYKF